MLAHRLNTNCPFENPNTTQRIRNRHGMNKPISPKQLDVSQRKKTLREQADIYAPLRSSWLKRATYFHEIDKTYMRFLIPGGKRVLELGCGFGDLLASVEPELGVGVDLSPKIVELAEAAIPRPNMP